LKKIADFLKADMYIYKRDIWEKLLKYSCIVAYMPSGIVVRGICKYLRSKWEDPAIIVIDKPMKYAIPILGAHHGGNEVAYKLKELGITPIITTAMEYESGLSIGIGCRKGVKADEIFDAIVKGLYEIGAELKDVRVLATAEIKRGERGIIEAADRMKKPLMFVKTEDINLIRVVSDSKANKVGLRSVAEACALYYSKEKKLLLPKKVFGRVTIAIAR